MALLVAAAEERNKQFMKKMVLILGDMLLTVAVDDTNAAKPFFASQLVIAAMLKAQGPDRQRHQDILWKQVN